MDFVESAIKYFEYGLSVIPIGSNKLPIGLWKQNTISLIKPNDVFKNCDGIGIVCGTVSGFIETIDVDEKYSLDGKLFENYKKLIHEQDPNLLKKLTVQKTQNNGYHLIYRCKTIDGNKKLANRYLTEAEKILNSKEKSKCLIETRGENGYIMISPSPKYKIIYGSLDNINYLSDEERSILLDCAKTFNEVYEKPIVKKEFKKVITENSNPFEDWNSRGDVLQLLQNEGWKITLQRGNKNLLLRPGGTGKWSADWDSEKRLFYVFTSSSEFENSRAYNSVQVLSILKFNNDFSECAKWLKKEGFGIIEKTSVPKASEIKTEDDNLDFVENIDDQDSYIGSVIDGSFKMGLTTGYLELDKYFRFKEKTLVIINGHDNVGKSIVLWFLAVVSSKLHGWRWIIFSAENSTGGILRKLEEFYLGRPLRDISENEKNRAKEWVKKHFVILKTDNSYTYMDVLNMGEKIIKKNGKYNGLLIDPYNSLYRDSNKSKNSHEYDYDALGDIRHWINKKDCSVYINCHAVTEALRQKYSKEHPRYAGLPMPPMKADTEGGGKFSNRADDFVTIHRHTTHPTDYVFSEFHVRKIKEMETGGRPTPFDNPVILKLINGGSVFEDTNGNTPFDKENKQIDLKPNLGLKPNTSFYEKEPVEPEPEPCPF